MRFFEPSEEFLDWLASYAGDRIVYDVGCGEGHIVSALHQRKVKALGIEMIPFERKLLPQLYNKVLIAEAQHCELLRKHEGLVFFARPCHSGFVEETIKVLHPQSEILYISKPENLSVDLPNYKYLKLNIETGGEEGEAVYRVNRKWLKK